MASTLEEYLSMRLREKDDEIDELKRLNTELREQLYCIHKIIFSHVDAMYDSLADQVKLARSHLSTRCYML